LESARNFLSALIGDELKKLNVAKQVSLLRTAISAEQFPDFLE
jgi:hypothetical protein